MKPFIALFALLLLSLAACAPEQAQQQPIDREVVDDDREPSAPQPAQEPDDDVEIDEPLVGEDTMRVPNAQTQELLAKSEQVRSYSFIAAPLPGKFGTNTYMIYGDKARIKPATFKSMSGWSADYIYADMAAKTANGYCIEIASCKKQKLKGVVEFAPYDIPLPESWLDQIKYGEKAGSVSFNDRPVTVVRWEEDGRHYEAYVDNFFGVPHRIAIATDEGMKDLVGGIEYQAMAVNTVQPEQVTAPY